MQALSLLEENFFVLYGDSWLDIDYKAVEKKYFSAGKSGLMSVLKITDAGILPMWKYVISRFTFTVKQIEIADDSYRLWLGILSKDVFKDYPSNEKFDLSIVYETLSEKKIWPVSSQKKILRNRIH